MSERTAFMTIARAAAPLYVTTLAASAGSLVDTALLGRHATVSLAAFAVTIAVFSPATATVAGALRGVMPFVTPHRDDPEGLLPLVRSGMWLAFAVGGCVRRRWPECRCSVGCSGFRTASSTNSACSPGCWRAVCC
ncbi:hypothetical protein N7U49_38370 [Streptomyces sp. AD2-2]|nr:hypothetical protein N7U49_38370 [Streptomyces sp. AD2-2]